MTELRRGPIGNRWVIVAPIRGKRPSDFHALGEKAKDLSKADCPFCPGNEDKTPPEIYRVSNPDGSWQVRVVPNKFPALSDDFCGLEQVSVDGLYQRMSGRGRHEVIIESPDHRKGIAELSLSGVEKIVDTFAVRLREIKKDIGHKFVLLFENHGKPAGASLSHPHAQIVATPIVPQMIRRYLQEAHSYYKDKGQCVFCDVLRTELRSGERVIEESDEYVVYAPYASCFPFEMKIMPKEHSHRFTDITGVQRREFADILKRTLRRLKDLLDDPPYNLMLHTAPNVSARSNKHDYYSTLEDGYHWRVVIIPRLTVMAGLEHATGFYINPVPPEQAAQYLREA